MKSSSWRHVMTFFSPLRNEHYWFKHGETDVPPAMVFLLLGVHFEVCLMKNHIKYMMEDYAVFVCLIAELPFGKQVQRIWCWWYWNDPCRFIYKGLWIHVRLITFYMLICSFFRSRSIFSLDLHLITVGLAYFALLFLGWRRGNTKLWVL